MKRINMIVILITSLLVLSPAMLYTPAASAAAPSVVVDGNQLQFDVPPVVQNGRTLVPMRAIFEALGAIILWDQETQIAAAVKGDTVVAVQIGNSVGEVNELEVSLDVPPQVINGRTMVPLRFVSEAFGCDVGWNQQTTTITISTYGTPVEDNNTNNNDYNNNEALGIIGSWSSLESSPTGTLVDPITGGVEGSYSSGEWYIFRSDGTCRYVIASYGFALSGVAEVFSTYEVIGDQIFFTNQIENSYPSDGRPTVKGTSIPNNSVKFKYNSEADTLRIDGVTTFYRIKE